VDAEPGVAEHPLECGFGRNVLARNYHEFLRSRRLVEAFGGRMQQLSLARVAPCRVTPGLDNTRGPVP
jgi:hypothetical protein